MENMFALTISPRPRWGDIDKIYDSDRFLIRRYLNRCTNNYIIYPEIDFSDRLHYHGTFQMKDKIKWYRSTKKNLASLGYICVKKLRTTEDLLRWDDYIRKDWNNNDIIFESPITPKYLSSRLNASKPVSEQSCLWHPFRGEQFANSRDNAVPYIISQLYNNGKLLKLARSRLPRRPHENETFSLRLSDMDLIRRFSRKHHV